MGWRDDESDDDIGVRRRAAEPQQMRGPLLGITSLVLGILSVLLFAGTLTAFSLLPPPAAPGGRDPAFTILAIVAVSIPAVAFVGLVLGAIGAFSSDPSGSLCSIIGIVLNGVVLIVSLVLMCLGIGMVGLGCLFFAALIGLMGQNNRARR